MSDAAEVLFATLGAIAGVAWLLMVIEWVGTMGLWPWVYRLGLVAYREPIAAILPVRVEPSRIETKRGICRSVDASTCLFRYRVRLFGATLHTPFLVKGRICRRGDTTLAEGRLPLFPFVFLAVWLTGCTCGGILLLPQDETFWVGVGLLALGWLFPFGMCLLSLPFEIGRSLDALVELAAPLGASADRPGAPRS